MPDSRAPAYRRENRAEVITRPLVILRSCEDGEKTVDGKEGLRLDGVIMPLLQPPALLRLNYSPSRCSKGKKREGETERERVTIWLRIKQILQPLIERPKKLPPSLSPTSRGSTFLELMRGQGVKRDEIA